MVVTVRTPDDDVKVVGVLLWADGTIVTALVQHCHVISTE